MTLVVGIVTGPSLIVRTPLLNSLLAWAVPELAGKVTIGAANVSWWSAPDLQDITVLDLQDRKVLHVGRLVFDKSLLQLILNPAELGGIQIVHPDAYVVVHDKGSNVEEFVSICTGDGAPSSPPEPDSATSFRLYVSDGHVTIADEVTGQITKLRDINVTYQPTEGDVHLVAVSLAGKVDAPDHPGTFSSEISWRPTSGQTPKGLGSGTVKVSTRQVPLATLKPLLARYCPDLALQGQLSGSVDSSWSSEDRGPVVHVTSHMRVDAMRLAIPSLLGGDTIADPKVTLDFDGWLDHDRLRMERLEARSSLAEGTLRLQSPISLWTVQDLRSLIWDPRYLQQLQCQGTINLPQVAASLPTTLRLHPGLVLQEGTIAFEVGATAVEGVRAVHGQVTTNRIVGTADNQTITWEEPLSVRWDIAATPQGLQLREAICESPFLRLRGSGDMQHGTLQVHASLHELSSNLRRFVDLGELELAGELAGDGQWRSEQDRMSGTLQGSVTGLVLRNKDQSLPEGQIAWRGQWEAALRGSQLKQWLSASAAVESGDDILQARLTRPVPADEPSAAWPIQVTLDGQLERWLARVQPWFQLAGYDARGRVHCDVTGEFSGGVTQLAPVTAEFTNLQVTSESLHVQEPRVVIEGQLTWDSASDRLLIPQATLASNSLAARGQDLRIEKASSHPEPSGTIAYRGDLARLARTLRSDSAPTLYPAGNLEGQLQFQFSGPRRDFRITAVASPFAISRRAGLAIPAATELVPLWEEPRVSLESQGTYDSQSQLVNCSSFQLASDGFSVSAQGSLRTPDGFIDASGKYQYDLRKLQGKIALVAARDWMATGQRQHDFRIQGPLFAPSPAIVSPQLKAEFGVGWDALRILGIDIGPQQITATLDRGIIDLAPIDASLQGGRIRIDSRVDLSSDPASWILEAPASLENVQLTPDLVHRWLKYVTPLVADTTSASGVLSIHVADARVPLFDPQAAMVTGRIGVQEARLQPGPMLQNLLGIVGEISVLAGRDQPLGSGLASSLASLSPQEVEFQVLQGRIHHRRLQLQLGDTLVSTQGSVGLDQTLSLVAEIPISDKWLGNERLLQGLRGQTLQLPIQGTFSQPHIDRRAVAQWTQQAVGSSAERLLQDEIQKGLQKLLGPK